MANELRKRQLAVGGLVEDNPLTSSATIMNSAGVAAINGGVASTEHMAIVLDPDGVDGAPEVAYLLDVTAGASVTGATGLLRGQEGTTARAHVAGTPWVHAATPRDVGDLAWTTYTPAWTSTGTAPSLGNGTLTGAYTQIGKTVHFRLSFTAGSTTTFGTGNWRFSLPLAARAIDSNSVIAGSAYLEDLATQGYVAPVLRFVSTTTFTILAIGSSNGQGLDVTPSVPFAWGNGDYLRVAGTYELA